MRCPQFYLALPCPALPCLRFGVATLYSEYFAVVWSRSKISIPSLVSMQKVCPHLMHHSSWRTRACIAICCKKGHTSVLKLALWTAKSAALNNAKQKWQSLFFSIKVNLRMMCWRRRLIARMSKGVFFQRLTPSNGRTDVNPEGTKAVQKKRQLGNDSDTFYGSQSASTYLKYTFRWRRQVCAFMRLLKMT